MVCKVTKYMITDSGQDMQNPMGQLSQERRQTLPPRILHTSSLITFFSPT